MCAQDAQAAEVRGRHIRVDMPYTTQQNKHAVTGLPSAVAHLFEFKISCHFARKVQCDGIGRWHSFDMAQIDTLVVAVGDVHVVQHEAHTHIPLFGVPSTMSSNNICTPTMARGSRCKFRMATASSESASTTAKHHSAISLDYNLLHTTEGGHDPVRDPDHHTLSSRPASRGAKGKEAPEQVGIVPKSPALPRVSCKHTKSCVSVMDTTCQNLAVLHAASPPMGPKSKAEFRVQTAIGATPDIGEAHREPHTEGAPGGPSGALSGGPLSGDRQAAEPRRVESSTALTIGGDTVDAPALQYRRVDAARPAATEQVVDHRRAVHRGGILNFKAPARPGGPEAARRWRPGNQIDLVPPLGNARRANA